MLRHDLARGDAAIGSITPVLRQLLGHGDLGLFGDDVLARLRGMLADLVRQLAGAEAGDAARTALLALTLPEVPGLLAHLHALALEGQVSDKLHKHLGLDPVLSPLLQALIASPDGETAAQAMKLLAAQSRFVQTQHRMQLPLGELPGELLHGVLAALGNQGQADTRAAIRTDYDESATRLGLIGHLVSRMGPGALAALALPHAGVAIFATALAQAHGGAEVGLREFSILCLQERQALRLALSLRATGVTSPCLAENLAALHPDCEVPEMVFRVSPQRAAELLNESRQSHGAPHG